MPLIGGSKFVERLQFFEGQRLFASDLQNVGQFHREMRWLHNQSLHQPGIGSGYAVSGPKGAREVTIQPGYAIDALGREIVLTEARVEQVPPVADDGTGRPVAYDLTVAYPGDDELEESETREGICVGRGVVRRREMPAFCWVRLGPEPERLPIDPVLSQQLAADLRIRLARAEIFNCQLHQPIALAQRRSARPAQQPHVGCGRSGPDGWKIEILGAAILLTMSVDTASAGFRVTPCYFAHLAGDRVIASVNVVIDGFSSISEPTATGFTFSFFIPIQLFATEVDAAALKALQAVLKDQDWMVEWIGVEG